MKITLIDGWKQAWKLHTVIIAAALGALNWIVDHPDFFTPDIAAALADVLPPNVVSALNRWVPLLLILARVIRQPNAAPTNTAPAAPASPPQPPGASQ